jgi:carbonic anhydrase
MDQRTGSMDEILEGYAHFRSQVFPQHRKAFSRLRHGQNPETLFVTCADSRVVPGLITHTEPGDLFIVRNVGNLVPAHGDFTGGVSSAIEYGVLGLGVKHIVVLGHTDCGAMKAILHPEKIAAMKSVSAWLHHAQAAKHVVELNHPKVRGHRLLQLLTEENVVMQLDHLRTHPSVAARLRQGSLELHGWLYDIAHGTLAAWEASKSKFLPLGAK